MQTMTRMTKDRLLNDQGQLGDLMREAGNEVRRAMNSYYGVIRLARLHGDGKSSEAIERSKQDIKYAIEHCENNLAKIRTAREDSIDGANDRAYDLIGGDWSSALRLWRTMSDIFYVESLDEFTRDDLDFLQDASRNTVLNSLGLSNKANKFFKSNPGLKRGGNYMSGTYLYAANPQCKHTSDRRSSGTGCSKCTGWFCF
jgi:hypothetical protein